MSLDNARQSRLLQLSFPRFQAAALGELTLPGDARFCAKETVFEDKNPVLLVHDVPLQRVWLLAK